MSGKVPNQKPKKHILSGIFISVTALLLGLVIGIGIFFPQYMPTSPWMGNQGDNSYGDTSNVRPGQQVKKGKLPETALAPESYLNQIAFLGDSLTYGLGQYGFIPEEQVFAEVGLSHTTALTKQFLYVGYPYPVNMVDAMKKIRPTTIVFMMGINGIAWVDEAEFFRTYELLVTRIHKASPKSVIILESILPVSDGQVASQGYRFNHSTIVNYNKRIEALATKHGFYYLDTAEVFRMSDNSANLYYYAGDGMHLNKNGYNLMLEYIRRHAYTMTPVSNT